MTAHRRSRCVVLGIAVALVGGCSTHTEEASMGVSDSSARPTLSSEPTTSLFGGALSGDALQAEVLRRVAGRFTEVGRASDGRLVVGLRANQRALADEIVEAYGDRVAVRLGFLPYPDVTLALPNARPPCGDPVLPVTTKATVRLVWRSEPSTFVVKSGDSFEGVVTFTNVGTSEMPYQSGDVTSGFVSRVDDDRIVARNDIEIAGIGQGGVLKPGESASVRMISSTASCDPDLGWILPAGDYGVRVSFDGFVSSPFPVTVAR